MSNKFTLANHNVKFVAPTEGIKSFYRIMNRYTELDYDTERQYLIDYRTKGDISAREKLILHNQAFVYANAKRYAANEDEILDYVDEGNEGLIYSIDKFDLTCETRLLTFAVWYIRRAMNHYLVDVRNMVKKSNNAKLFKKLDKVNYTFYSQHGRYPSEEEMKTILTDEYNIEIKDNSDLYNLAVTSIDSNIGNEDDDLTFENSGEFNVITASENEYNSKANNEHNREILSQILCDLSDEDKDIITRYYSLDELRNAETIEEIAEDYIVDVSVINRKIKNIIAKMQNIAAKKQIAM